MSELYEAVVFGADEPDARAALASARSPLRLRLVRLAAGAFGIYRVADRSNPFDLPRIEHLAAHVAECVGQATALAYDNRSDGNLAVFYRAGQRVQEFSMVDEWWVSLGEDGEPERDGPRYRASQLRPDEEYECV